MYVQPICVQIAALGGQGGGVLAEWLSEAAYFDGYPAQVTSIPGVAQRTGATTYYLEMLPQKNPDLKPIFCLFPDADGLDLMVAMEPLEAARALSLGLISERTTVITATRRVYSTSEKSVAGDGAYSSADIFSSLKKAAGKLIQLDIEALTGRADMPGNAAMLGAIAASDLLPFTEEAYRFAITSKGVVVDRNLKDFEQGRGHQRGSEKQGNPLRAAYQKKPAQYNEAPVKFIDDLEKVPEEDRALVGHALAALVDYQDSDYAGLYLSRLTPFYEVDRDVRREVTKRLAAWMCYEDVIRVGQLKTRPGRFARIRDEVDVGEGDPFTVVDFLKPGREELASLMPPVIGKIIMNGAPSQTTTGLRLKITATSPWGYGCYRLLANLRSWRPKTWRYLQEQEAIESWLAGVKAASRISSELGHASAQIAVLARGYGSIRKRGLSQLAVTFKNLEQNLKEDHNRVLAEMVSLLDSARNDPDRKCGS